MINTDLRQLFLTPTGFLALGFGTGLAPKAPGTFGTLVAVPFLWLFAWLPLWEAGVVVFLALLIGIPICERASRQLGQSDPGAIVWDEIVGLWLVFLGLPLTWLTVILGVALFRFFDILKPWPICWADRKVRGGVGIMLDDILAAAYATLVLRLVLVFSGWLFSA